MSILVNLGDDSALITAIEYRPGEGLAIRIKDDAAANALTRLTTGLTAALRGSAFQVYRYCCDTAPHAETPHADGCENAKKGQAR